MFKKLCFISTIFISLLLIAIRCSADDVTCENYGYSCDSYDFTCQKTETSCKSEETGSEGHVYVSADYGCENGDPDDDSITCPPTYTECECK